MFYLVGHTKNGFWNISRVKSKVQNTLSLIHTLQVKDHEIHTGQDEDTIILVNKLEKERELEQRNYDIERDKEAAKILEKTEDNFPNLEKPNKSSQ